jgi:hypothetical protein
MMYCAWSSRGSVLSPRCAQTNAAHTLTSNSPIYGKIVFSNARYRTPFIGMESYLRVVQQHRIPVCQDSVTAYPLGDDPGVILLNDEKERDAFMRPLLLTLPLALHGLESIGANIPTTDINGFSAELAKALHRGAGLHS